MKEYFKTLENYENGTDTLAICLSELEQLLSYAEVINRIIPDVIKRLEKGRKEIVRSSEKSWSDIVNMIDEFNPEGEEATYETTKKICDYYRDNVISASKK